MDCRTGAGRFSKVIDIAKDDKLYGVMEIHDHISRKGTRYIKIALWSNQNTTDTWKFI